LIKGQLLSRDVRAPFSFIQGPTLLVFCQRASEETRVEYLGRKIKNEAVLDRLARAG